MSIVPDAANALEHFSLLGEDEPGDERLQGLTRGMPVGVRTRARLARQRLVEILRRDTGGARAHHGLPPLRVSWA